MFNLSHYSNPAFDELVKQGRREGSQRPRGRHTKTVNPDMMSGPHTPSVFGVRGGKQVAESLTGKFALEINNIGADGTTFMKVTGELQGRLLSHL